MQLLHQVDAPHDDQTFERLTDHLIAASQIANSMQDDELRLLLRMSLFRVGRLVATDPSLAQKPIVSE